MSLRTGSGMLTSQLPSQAQSDTAHRLRDHTPESPMLVKVNCCALVGIDCVPVEVEVNVSRGQPRTTLIGLPGAYLFGRFNFKGKRT